MAKYHRMGGLRLKCSGRVTKEKLLQNFERALDALIHENDLESFSGANLYLQMYNRHGQRMMVVDEEGVELDGGLSVMLIGEDFSLKGYGLKMLTVTSYGKKQQQLRKQAQLERERHLEPVREIHRQMKAEQDRLNEFKRMVAQGLGIMDMRDFPDHVRSVGRIRDPRVIASYLGEENIPGSGAVYRASMRDPTTGKVRVVRIYNEQFELIAETAPKGRGHPKVRAKLAAAFPQSPAPSPHG